jgi:hypothetical protein
VRRLAAAAALGLAGCVVSPGATSDAAPCAPSPDYFVATVRLDYLDANQCASSGCHAFDDGHGYLRFQPFGDAPPPGTPLASWPSSWRDDYLAAIQLVRCDDALASRLLTVPEGIADPHPPGDSVGDHPGAELIFRTWVSGR